MPLRDFLTLSADYTLTEDVLVSRIIITPNSSGAGILTVRPNGSGASTGAFQLACVLDQSAQFDFDGLLLPIGALLDFGTNLAYVVVEYYPNDQRPGQG